MPCILKGYIGTNVCSPKSELHVAILYKTFSTFRDKGKKMEVAIIIYSNKDIMTCINAPDNVD